MAGGGSDFQGSLPSDPPSFQSFCFEIIPGSAHSLGLAQTAAVTSVVGVCSLGLAQTAAVTSVVGVCTQLGPGSDCCSYICGRGLHTAWAWLRLLQLHLWSGSAHSLGLAQAACGYICGRGLHTAWAWLRLRAVTSVVGVCTQLGPGSGCVRLHLWSGSAHSLGLAQAACGYICGRGLHTAWAWLRLRAVTSVVGVCTQLGPGSGCCSYIWDLDRMWITSLASAVCCTSRPQLSVQTMWWVSECELGSALHHRQY